MKNWKPITDISAVDEIIEASNERTQIIFKDSMTCGISAYAKSRLSEGNDLMMDHADFNYLDLLRYRDVSNYIAEVFNVYHQSPQILIVKNGKVTYTASHHVIQPREIAQNLK